MRRFYDYNGVVQRINHSVIRYKDVPVYVDEVLYGDPEKRYRVGDAVIVRLTDLLTGKHFSIDAESADLNTASPPLGYMNQSKRCVAFFLERIPRRRWKSGLNSENVAAMTPLGETMPTSSKMFRSSDIARTILNDYPTLQECEDKIAESLASPLFSVENIGHTLLAQAFHRQLALVKPNTPEDSPTYLAYQGEWIAEKQGNTFVLNEEFFYMKEFLEKQNLMTR